MRDQSNRHSFIQVVKIWIPDCGYRRNFSVALSAAKKWDRRRCRKPREHAQFKRVTPNTTDARATTRAQRGDRANTLPHPNANDILAHQPESTSTDAMTVQAGQAKTLLYRSLRHQEGCNDIHARTTTTAARARHQRQQQRRAATTRSASTSTTSTSRIRTYSQNLNYTGATRGRTTTLR